MPRIFHPAIHGSTHEDGGNDEIDLANLAGQQIFVPYNGKIADITHADTNKHTLDLQTALSETREIVAIIPWATRISGSGGFYMFPNEGTQEVNSTGDTAKQCFIVIKDGTNRIQYLLSVANDDWDLYCLGYVVEAA